MADEVVTPDQVVPVTVDVLLDNLTAQAEAVEKVNTNIKAQNIALAQRIADLEAQIDKHISDGSLTDAQLKKLQDVTERLSKLASV